MFSILNEQELSKLLEQLGEKNYRLPQIQQAIFKDGVESIEEMTTLPVALREELLKNCYFSSLKMVKEQHSQKDATTKVVFETQDNLYIESVLMRHLTGRITLCLSSQVGCPLGCTFCATGKMGLFRNLHWYEIVDQVLMFDRLLKKENTQVRNLVFMGMGEPLINYENVIRAVRTINDPKKMGKGARHITISTSGIVPGINKLVEEKIQVNLAISLHAPNDTLRTQIMPINRSFPLEKLMQALDKYTELTNKRIFYEYIMLREINDQPEQAHELGKLLKGKLAHVNLIPWNTVEGSEFKRSEPGVMKNFQKVLEMYDIPSTIRVSLGDDIAAACGQLVKKTTRQGTSIVRGGKIPVVK